MKVSLNWLKRYVDINVSTEELCEKMMMSGFEVDGIEDLSATMKNVVVGKIESIEKHPNAEKLIICMIDVAHQNGELVQIVTGATNVFENALVPVALHSSLLPNGTKIKKGKLRGTDSFGMLCSGEELLLEEKDYVGAGVDGILILKDDVFPGQDMRDVLHRNDIIIDFDITANRSDCLSMLGIAREVSVALGEKLTLPTPVYKTAGGSTGDFMMASVEDFENCTRYMGRCVDNIRIAPSPKWMQQCLTSAGMRPINNIVDITNFVMIETGQPMHAFDVRDVAGSHLIIRRAKNGEQLTTLDGKAHSLTENMLVISDSDGPSALAGIMGGQNSEIKDDTKTLFFESAQFSRASIRRTARSLGMRTEASARFEKGTDIFNTEYGLQRALQLVYDLDAGDILDGVIDCNNGLPKEKNITVSVNAIVKLLGVKIDGQQMVDILNQLEIKSVLSGDKITCTVPSFRLDISVQADIAEEVMRVFGYEHIVSEPFYGKISRGSLPPKRKTDDLVKSHLVSSGFSEIVTYSFANADTSDILNLDSDDVRRNAIKILNPLSEDYAYMRTQTITHMLKVMENNINKKNSELFLFELGKVYFTDKLPIEKQPDENTVLSIGICGGDQDFFSIKGIVESVADLFSLKTNFVRSFEPYLHPGRQAAALDNGFEYAVFGEVHPQVCEKYDTSKRLYIAELDMKYLYDKIKPKALYSPLPRFPAMERDLAFVCDRDIPVEVLRKTISENAGEHLEHLELFDVYTGTQIASDKKSVAYALVFRSEISTLTDDVVDRAINNIIDALKKKGCVLRS